MTTALPTGSRDALGAWAARTASRGIRVQRVVQLPHICSWDVHGDGDGRHCGRGSGGRAPERRQYHEPPVTGAWPGPPSVAVWPCGLWMGRRGRDGSRGVGHRWDVGVVGGVCGLSPPAGLCATGLTSIRSAAHVVCAAGWSGLIRDVYDQCWRGVVCISGGPCEWFVLLGTVLYQPSRVCQRLLGL